jgi:hypothetical protein
LKTEVGKLAADQAKLMKLKMDFARTNRCVLQKNPNTRKTVEALQNQHGKISDLLAELDVKTKKAL